MATATVAAFRAAHAEFAAVTDDTVTAALGVARTIYSLSEQGIIEVCAHLLAIASEDTAKADDGAGVVTAQTIGDRRAQYMTQAQGAGAAAWWARTSYGRLFLVLEQRSVARFPRVW